MCYKVTCSTCSLPTWAGCGKHIETALAGIPVDQRCKCPRGTSAGCVVSSGPAASGTKPADASKDGKC